MRSDSWYAAAQLRNLLDGWGWQYVMRLKSNRKFGAHALRTTWPHRYGHARGELQGVEHPVLVVKDGRRYWGTNDLSLTVREVKAHYSIGNRSKRPSVYSSKSLAGEDVRAKNNKRNGRTNT